LRTVQKFAPWLEQELKGGLDCLYARLERNKNTKKFYGGDSQLNRARQAQFEHWLQLVSAPIDNKYLETTYAIGMTHARIGVEPRYYIDSYAVVAAHILKSFVNSLADKPVDESENGGFSANDLSSLIKVIFLDMELSLSAYFSALADLKEYAFVDALTGMFNRRYMEIRLGQEIERAKRYNIELSALMIDIDFFKKINDLHGHLAGDEVLRHCASEIRSMSRASDILFRYGGDEILLLLPETGLRNAGTHGARILDHVHHRPCSLGNAEKYVISLSIGVGSLAPDEDMQALLAKVDKSLYAAKEAGRNRVHVSDCAESNV